MTREEEKIIKNAAKGFVYFGCLVTLAFAIYYIIDLLKDFNYGN
jgi:cytochrome c biogenesis factor